MTIKIYAEIRDENGIVQDSFESGALLKALKEIVHIEFLEEKNPNWTKKILLIDYNFEEDIDITECFKFVRFRTV